MLGLNSESGSELGLELGCIQYIKLLIKYIKPLIQYTINWVAFIKTRFGPAGRRGILFIPEMRKGFLLNIDVQKQPKKRKSKPPKFPKHRFSIGFSFLRF